MQNQEELRVIRFDKDRWLKSLGEATSIILNSRRKSSSIATIGVFVYPFIKLDQLHVCEGTNGFPAAYITWGYLTRVSIGRIIEDPSVILETEELNAGEHLVIFDILSNLRDFRPVARQVRRLIGHRPDCYGIRYDRRARRLVLRHYRFRRSPISS